MDKQTQGRIWYKLRGALIAPAYLFIFFCSYGETEHGLVFALGLALFAAGFILRVWSQMHLHYRLKEHKVLTLTGPYTMVRNPIYIGNTLILVGATLIAELVWFVPIMLAACMITYALVVRYEERHLSEKYGEPYREFLTKVPRWIPSIKSASNQAPINQMRFLIPSVVAELHILLLLVLPLFKELVFPHDIPL
jgi:protein-S-isoprenylcysteine O-methyltransferase Ste14